MLNFFNLRGASVNFSAASPGTAGAPVFIRPQQINKGLAGNGGCERA
jgi:hypothetical protein